MNFNRFEIPLLVMLAFMVVLSVSVSAQGSFETHVDTYVLNNLENSEPEIGVIVTLREEVNNQVGLASQGLNIDEDKVGYRYNSFNGFSAKLSSEEVERLKENDKVKRISYNYPVTTFLDDSTELINATSAWDLRLDDINMTGKDQSVCVIDSGIDYEHEAFGDEWGEKVIAGVNVIDSWEEEEVDDCNEDPSLCYDNNDHGTHVAGIAAANGTDLKGVAPDANIVVVKALEGETGDMGDVSVGVEWCANQSESLNISTIVMSLGTDCEKEPELCYDNYCDIEGWEFISEPINDAVGKGITVSVATGNNENETHISSPACIENSSRVGATTGSDEIAFYSNRWDLDMLVAPGSGINSTEPGDEYGLKNGTSMAAPHVSGAVALMRQYLDSVDQEGEPKYLEGILADTGLIVDDPDVDEREYPRIDVYSSLRELDEGEFVVDIVDYDEEVFKGENVIVNYTVENTADFERTQDIVFNVTNDSSHSVYTETEEELVLGGGDVYEEGQFVWETGEESGEYYLEVSSDDDSDNVTVDVRDQRKLTVDAEGEGNVSVSNIWHESGDLPMTMDFDNGTVVDLNASPAAEWSFRKWEGPVEAPHSTETSITMDSDHNVTAEFTEVTYFRFDEIGNQIAGEDFEINITAREGEVAEEYEGTANLTDTTGSIAPNETDNFTNGIWIGDVNITIAGVVNITAEDSEINGTSNNFVVEPADVDHIEIEPSEPDIKTAGDTIDFSAEAYDQYDNLVEDNDAEFTWESEASLNESGYLNETTAGEYEIDATYDDVTENVTVTIVSGNAENVSIIDQPADNQPAGENITAAESGDLGVNVTDVYGNPVENVNVSVSIEEYVFDAGNTTVTTNVEGIALFDDLVIEKVGDYKLNFTIDAEDENVDKYETVQSDNFTVVPAGPEYIEIGPEESTIIEGNVQEYNATAYDQYDNLIGDVTDNTTWSDDVAEENSSWDENEINVTEPGIWNVTGNYTDAGTSYTANATLEVLKESIFYVEILGIEPEVEVVKDEEVEVEYRVNNTGELDIEQDINFTVLNETGHAIHNITAANFTVPGADSNVSVFNWTAKDPGGTPHKLKVESEDYSDSENITVLVELYVDLEEGTGLEEIYVNDTLYNETAHFPLTFTYNYSESLILNATSTSDYEFSGWEVNGEEHDVTEIDVVMDDNKNVTATFEEIEEEDEDDDDDDGVENGWAPSPGAVSVMTGEVKDVTEGSAILTGEVTYLGSDVFEADVFFELRQSGEEDWEETGKEEVYLEESFEMLVEGLNPGTDYEYRAAIEAEADSDTGNIEEFSTETEPPEIVLLGPEDGSTDHSSEVTLGVEIIHPHDYYMDVRFYDASDGTLIEENISVKEGEVTVTWTDLDIGENYEWYVEVDDYVHLVTSDTWTFSTITQDDIDSLRSELDNVSEELEDLEEEAFEEMMQLIQEAELAFEDGDYDAAKSILDEVRADTIDTAEEEEEETSMMIYIYVLIIIVLIFISVYGIYRYSLLTPDPKKQKREREFSSVYKKAKNAIIGEEVDNPARVYNLLEAARVALDTGDVKKFERKIGKVKEILDKGTEDKDIMNLD